MTASLSPNPSQNLMNLDLVEVFVKMSAIWSSNPNFYTRNIDWEILVVVLYVDDQIITGSSSPLIHVSKQSLKDIWNDKHEHSATVS